MANFSYLTDVVDFFAWRSHDDTSFRLSDTQFEQLSEVRDELNDFELAGEPSARHWLELCDELLSS